MKLHLVVELEHQTDFLFFRHGSETAILGVEKYRFAVNAKNGLLNYQKCFLIFKKIICCDFRIFFSEKNIFFGSEMWISLKIEFLIPKWSWEPQKWNFCKYDFSFPFHHSLQNLSHEWPLVLKLDRFCKILVSCERRVFKARNPQHAYADNFFLSASGFAHISTTSGSILLRFFLFVRKLSLLSP